MGLRDWFKSGAAGGRSSKVLVCSLDERFDRLSAADFEIYSRFYPTPTLMDGATVQQMQAALKRKFDVVHLLCNVEANGAVVDSRGVRMSGEALIEDCLASDVKLLWIAADNAADRYIKALAAASRGKRINLVMSLERRGERFSVFLDRLLSRMASGETMPNAWVELCPQAEGPWQKELPSSIFSAGRADAVLR